MPRCAAGLFTAKKNPPSASSGGEFQGFRIIRSIRQGRHFGNARGNGDRETRRRCSPAQATVRAANRATKGMCLPPRCQAKEKRRRQGVPVLSRRCDGMHGTSARLTYMPRKGCATSRRNARGFFHRDRRREKVKFLPHEPRIRRLLWKD